MFSVRFTIETIRYRSFISKELVLSLTSLVCTEYMDTSVTVPDTWIYKCDCTGYLDTQVWLYPIPGSTSVTVPDT